MTAKGRTNSTSPRSGVAVLHRPGLRANSVKIVPAFLLPPVIVTKANAAAADANDPVLSLLTT